MILKDSFEYIDFASQTTEGFDELRSHILDLALQGFLTEKEENKASVGLSKKPDDFDENVFVLSNAVYKYKPKGSYLTIIGDLAKEIANGYSGKQDKDLTKGVPISRIETIAKESIDETRIGYSKTLEECDVQKYKLLNGDILFSHINSDKHLGKTAIFNKTSLMVHGVNLLKIRFDQKTISSEFMNLYFRYMRSSGFFIRIAQKAINQASINQKKIRSMAVFLPPLEEQKRIVAKVDQLMALCDELEAKQEKQTHTRRQLNDAALNALLSAASPEEFEKHWQRIVDNFALLYHDLENLNSLRQVILDLAFKGRLTLLNKSLELPDGWKLGKIGENFEVVTGSTPPTNERSNYSEDEADCPFFKPTDLNFGLNVKTASSYISEKGKKYCRLIPAKTVSVTCIGATIGKTGLLQVAGTTNQQINSIVPNEKFIPEYVYFYCLSNSFQTQIINNASSTTLPILSKGKFETLTIPVAPLADQKRIVAKVDQLMALCDELEKKLTAKSAHLEKLTESLLRV